VSSPEPADLTFEDGYTRLQAIATRLGSDEVPVSEMVDLYAAGKGLEAALLSHLDEANGRIEAIERGDGVQQFRIVATRAKPAADGVNPSPPPQRANPATETGGDDDIPF
jgi:exodeoxyribonuclease VII small subunit